MDGTVTLSEAIEQGRKWDADAPLAPLILEYDVCETHENIQRNIRLTLESEYKPFNALLGPPHETPISICGFGPSIKESWNQLKGDIWTCNGAHDWLIEKGIVPKYAMFWDAAEVVSHFVHPHHGVIYLVASRCHRSVFDALQGHDVYVWHASGDTYLDDLLCEYKRAEPMISGGSAAVTRAMVVCTTMGYRNIHLFGADSSYIGDYTHAKESIVEEKALEIWCDGRKFCSTGWLAGQVEDFKLLGPIMRTQGCHIELYGDGLLQHIAKMHDFVVHSN
jgi:hypothetical protein